MGDSVVSFLHSPPLPSLPQVFLTVTKGKENSRNTLRDRPVSTQRWLGLKSEVLLYEFLTPLYSLYDNCLQYRDPDSDYTTIDDHPYGPSVHLRNTSKYIAYIWVKLNRPHGGDSAANRPFWPDLRHPYSGEIPRWMYQQRSRVHAGRLC